MKRVESETGVVAIERHGAVMAIMLNRPGAANAIDPAMIDGLQRAIDAAEAPEVRAIILAGRGRHFCAGSDLKAAACDPARMDLATRLNPLIVRLAALEKPLVAAISGAAAGGGMGLALAADLRVMGQSARLVPAWLSLGLVPDMGASWFLARMLGPARAASWLLRGEAMGSEEALACGLASEVVVDGTELTEALALATRLADCPGPATALTRALLASASQVGLGEQLELEAEAQTRAMRDPAQIAALAAAVAAMSARR